MRNPDLPFDIALLLREARHSRGLSQKDLARLSGIGEKTLSSFETSRRVGSLKLAQLQRLLRAMGLTLTQFFARDIYPAGSAEVIQISHRSLVKDRVTQLREWIEGAREDGIAPQEISDMFGRLHYSLTDGRRATGTRRLIDDLADASAIRKEFGQ